MLVFAGRNSDAILNTDVGGQGYRTSGQLCLVLVRSERQTPDSIFLEIQTESGQLSESRQTESGQKTDTGLDFPEIQTKTT